MNKIIIIGNLCADPQLRSTRDGTPVCTFTVAVSRRQKSAEAGKPDADFFRVTAWRALGESCGKYLQKGRKVGVTGSVSVNTYTAQDGSFRASMEVVADDVEFLTPKDQQPPLEQPRQESKPQFVQVDDEELPF